MLGIGARGPCRHGSGASRTPTDCLDDPLTEFPTKPLSSRQASASVPASDRRRLLSLIALSPFAQRAIYLLRREIPEKVQPLSPDIIPGAYVSSR